MKATPRSEQQCLSSKLSQRRLANGKLSSASTGQLGCSWRDPDHLWPSLTVLWFSCFSTWHAHLQGSFSHWRELLRRSLSGSARRRAVRGEHWPKSGHSLPNYSRIRWCCRAEGVSDRKAACWQNEAGIDWWEWILLCFCLFGKFWAPASGCGNSMDSWGTLSGTWQAKSAATIMA